MNLRHDAIYDLMTVSSMGLRMTAAGRMPTAISRQFEIQATSAETNVLNVSASLGKRCKVLTRFIEDSPVSFFIKSELRRRNIEYEGPDIPQGGPWGYRHQINIADSGYGFRGPLVWNDRAGEVGRDLSADEYDLERIFKVEGCRILHLSGLVAALSPQATAACVEIAEYAKAHGTLISFDLNHRASFWEGREEELRASFTRIAELCTILIGNEEDYQLALGIQGPPPGDEHSPDADALKIEGFKQMIQRASEQFPDVKVFGNTLRHVRNANTHAWGGLLYMNGEWVVEEPREIEVMDRIGGGDGFVAGLLYSLLQDWSAEDSLGFAWATGAMATSVMDDYATPTSEDQVRAIYQGNARVKR